MFCNVFVVSVLCWFLTEMADNFRICLSRWQMKFLRTHFWHFFLGRNFSRGEGCHRRHRWHHVNLINLVVYTLHHWYWYTPLKWHRFTTKHLESFFREREKIISCLNSKICFTSFVMMLSSLETASKYFLIKPKQS